MIEIKPLKKCDAVTSIPGSKSYTHRALITSALAEGESILINALQSDDTNYTEQVLEKFGVSISREKNIIRVQGRGGKFDRGGKVVYVGDSGTSMRFISAVAALRHGMTVLDGSERLRQRPMESLLAGLNALGVKAYSQEGTGFPPIVVESRGVPGGVASVKGSESSQFLSALLLVAPYAQGDVRLEVIEKLASKPYVDITRDVMASFGVEVRTEDSSFFSIRRGQRYLPQSYWIEGDASNASYFLAAAAVTKGRVRVDNLKATSVQGDIGFLGILEKMGCQVICGDRWVEVQGKELKRIDIDMNAMPDVVPTLAVVAAFAQGKTMIRNIGHLRLKESDRIQAVARELNKMGARVEEGNDWLKVDGGSLHGAEIETYNDHRIAMSFAIAGLVVPGIKIHGEQCVKKSFPDFWEKWKELY
jgi:3-phosphoshikimate 1-carboxyvinyltransferase